MQRASTAEQMALSFGHELIIDNFAGGGGTSEGLEQAFGRPVDIAINHDPEALAMHAINHPHTLHLCESVWEVDPIAVTGNRPVALVWLSPDCKHFSKAKGGTPVEKSIRGLAWVGMRWVALCKPRVLMLENVEEFQEWGPLLVLPDGTFRPDPAKKGKTFQSFVRQLRQHGYTVDWREMRACDNGAPTIRKRLFLIARRDGHPIVWPEATHGSPDSRDVVSGNLLPWRTAAECIDFSLPAQSLFGRKKPLAENTQRRVAKGLWRHVLSSGKPFIVGVGGRMGQSPERSVDQPVQTITSKADSCVADPVLAPFLNEHANASNQRTMPADEPLRTICAQVKGGHFSVVGANLVTLGYGERKGQEARTHAIESPLGTVVAGGVKQGLVAAHLVDMGHGESCSTGAKRWSSGARTLEAPLNTVTASSVPSALAAIHLTHLTHHGDMPGLRPDQPLPTITAAHRGEQAIVAACMEQANGGFYGGDGRKVDSPMSTITASGSNQQLVMAYLVKYYSLGGQDAPAGAPMHTIPTKGRMGLVEVRQVPASSLAEEHRDRARQCAALLHEHLPEQFPELADMVVMQHAGAWWVLVDITLRMLKPRELFNAQGFPRHYVIHEIPDPSRLFVDGVQVAKPLEVPRIPLSATAQVRMCGNSVSPFQSKALALSNFGHESAVRWCA